MATVASDWDERFTAYAESKTRAAAEAQLEPLRTEIDAAGKRFESIATRWSSALFDGPFYLSPAPEDLPGVGLVFVQSHDGNTVADDPSDLGGGETDKHLIYEGLSRVTADAVLAGAGTVRGGDVVFSVWHPDMIALRESLGLARHPTQIIVTLRGLEFARALLLNVPAVPVIIVTPAHIAKQMTPATVERPWIRTIAIEDPDALAPAFRELRALGIRRVSVVGGRTVAAALVRAGLAQDLYLTTSPRDGGVPDTPLFTTPPPRELVVRKHGTGRDQGVVFEHWHLSNDG